MKNLDNLETEKAKLVTLSELQSQNKNGNKFLDGNFSIISDLKINLEAIIGSAELTVKELFELQEGSIVKLEQTTDTQLMLRLNGKIIARGSLVVVGDNFGIQVTDILENSATSIKSN